MHFRICPPAALTILSSVCCCTAAVAQEKPAATESSNADVPAKIVIQGKALSDTDERRYSTAAKQVFGREEIDRHGDSSIADVLKRLPGVTMSGTPGRGGDIRMRGLGSGYTMILLNGEPVPRGFSLDSLPPDQVERIEVMRGPVAEHSARAVAGTINIVLRGDVQKKSNEARAQLEWEQGHVQPSLSLQHSDQIDTFSYMLGGNLMHRDQKNQTQINTTAIDTTTGAPSLIEGQQDQSHAIWDGLHLNGRFNWRLGQGENVSVQPFLMLSQRKEDGSTTLDVPVGTARYAEARWHGDSDRALARLMFNLNLRMADGARLEVKASGGLWDSSSETRTRQFDGSDQLLHNTNKKNDLRDTSASTSGKYARSWREDHRLAAGWELEAGRRNETTRFEQDGSNPLAAYGENIRANTRRYALYAQDEWDISPLWSAYAGLRGETLRTEAETALSSDTNTSTVLSPLLHSVWRFSEASKDQIRLGLTRSYRAPTTAQLAAAPAINTDYPVTATNTPTNADSIGNPRLKPELAWGLDLAYEHYLGAGGLMSASIFHRSINDVIRNVTTLQTVPWSGEQRWVSSPTNLGNARSYGVELEAKLRLNELIDAAPGIDLRANYSRFWSTVSDISGPNNRLDQQPTYTANIGADYRLPGTTWTVGGSYNWTPAYTVKQTEAQTYTQGLKRVIDLYALWKIVPDVQLRLSASNCLHDDYQTANQQHYAGFIQTATSIQSTHPAFAARIEAKF